jgi:hypothetical protein
MKVAVIGAGPAGIYFSKLCLDNGHAVTLIEAGNKDSESRLLTKNSYNFISKSAMPENVHMVGGGSRKWRGRISEFLESDFRKNAVLDQAWPYSKSTLAPHYKKLYKFLNSGDLTDQEVINCYFNDVTGLIPEEFYLRSFRFCKPDFFINFLLNFENHSNFKFLTNHFCEKISLDKSLNITLKNEFGRETSENFDRVVIACGTLQTTELLTRSCVSLKIPKSELMGKYLMEHIEGYIGDIRVKSKSEKKLFKKICSDFQNRSIYDFNGFGVALSFSERIKDEATNINTQYEIRRYIPRLQIVPLWLSNKGINKGEGYSVFELFLWLTRVIRYFYKIILRIIDKLMNIKRFSIYVKSEEIGNFESEILPEMNFNGLLNYKHKISNETYDLLLKDIQCFQKIFTQKFKAKLKFYYRFDSNLEFKNIWGPNFHPMGTTRLGTDSQNSVCDSNLKVHGVDDLFLLSASVFPSGSNTNPTFTVLALADRLASSEFFLK